jgi:hypothetical protein
MSIFTNCTINGKHLKQFGFKLSIGDKKYFLNLGVWDFRSVDLLDGTMVRWWDLLGKHLYN